MPVQNSTLRYGTVAMTLHWLIAAFVIANIGIGLYMSDCRAAIRASWSLFPGISPLGSRSWL